MLKQNMNSEIEKACNQYECNNYLSVYGETVLTATSRWQNQSKCDSLLRLIDGDAKNWLSVDYFVF